MTAEAAMPTTIQRTSAVRPGVVGDARGYLILNCLRSGAIATGRAAVRNPSGVIELVLTPIVAAGIDHLRVPAAFAVGIDHRVAAPAAAADGAGRAYY